MDTGEYSTGKFPVRNGSFYVMNTNKKTCARSGTGLRFKERANTGLLEK